MKMFADIIRAVIRSYQIFVSPSLGVHCRFFPSCSEYADEAIKQHGFFRGSMKTIARLLRCQPFASGGHDPVSK